MELNRNHFFVLGTVLLLVGIQFRFIDSFVLNEKSSRFIAERFGGQKTVQVSAFPNLLSVMSPPVSRRTVKPPAWLGWSLISVGAVLTLHSLAMRRPD